MDRHKESPTSSTSSIIEQLDGDMLLSENIVKQIHTQSFPVVITLKILALLSANDLQSLAQTNRSMRAISEDDVLWYELIVNDFSIPSVIIDKIKRSPDKFNQPKIIYRQLKALAGRFVSPTHSPLPQDKPPYWLVVIADLEVFKNYLAENPAMNLAQPDSSGRNVLYWAAASGKKDMVEFLVKTGLFDLRVSDSSGHTLFHFAAAGGSKEVIEFLMEADGFALDARDDRYRTVLHYAARRGNKESVEFLLLQYHKKKYKIPEPDCDNCTVLDCAVLSGNTEISDLIGQYVKYDLGSHDFRWVNLNNLYSSPRLSDCGKININILNNIQTVLLRGLMLERLVDASEELYGRGCPPTRRRAESSQRCILQ